MPLKLVCVRWFNYWCATVRPSVGLAISMLMNGLIIGYCLMSPFLVLFASLHGEWITLTAYVLGIFLAAAMLPFTCAITIVSFLRILIDAFFKGLAIGLAGNK